MGALSPIAEHSAHGDRTRIGNVTSPSSRIPLNGPVGKALRPNRELLYLHLTGVFSQDLTHEHPRKKLS